jgi:hypothetical protein
MLLFVNANDTLLHCIYLIRSIHHTLLDIWKYVMMQSYLWQMVHMRTSKEPLLDIPNSSVGCGHGQAPHGNAPPPPPCPPVSLDPLLASQNDLTRLLMENETRHGADRP